MGNKNFDRELLLKLGAERYYANKAKAGASSSTAGVPRPYAKQNVLKARLFSPQTVGQSITVTPKHAYRGYSLGHYYSWEVSAPGEGEIDGTPITAEEISKHFIVKYKGRG